MRQNKTIQHNADTHIHEKKKHRKLVNRNENTVVSIYWCVYG